MDLFGRKLMGESDRLKGYKITPVIISDQAFLARGEDQNQKIAISTNNPADKIEGTAFEVSGDELLQSDQYEPVDYKRVMVQLESGRSAWVYAAI